MGKTREINKTHVSFKRTWGTTSPEVFLEVQKTLEDLKILTEDSNTVLDVPFTFSKLPISFGSFSPEQPCL